MVKKIVAIPLVILICVVVVMMAELIKERKIVRSVLLSFFAAAAFVSSLTNPEFLGVKPILALGLITLGCFAYDHLLTGKFKSMVRSFVDHHIRTFLMVKRYRWRRFAKAIRLLVFIELTFTAFHILSK